MKTTATLLRSAIAFGILTSFPLSSHAQLSWGVNGAGGTSTWNATNTNWYDGVNNVVWNSGNATFGGTAGTVTVSGTQDASGLTFTTPGYTFGSGTINLTGAPTISGLATINTTLTGSNGMTLINGSKTISGNNTGLTGVVSISGTGSSFVAGRIANNNALGSSSAFADRLVIAQGAQGATLQLNAGVILPKYISTTGTTTIQTITGNTELTGNFVPGGTVLFDLAANTNLTLSNSAGLGQSGSSIQATGSGRLVVNAAAGVTAYGLFIRNSAAVQVNSGATLGSPNVFFDGAAGDTTLSLNGATVSNNLFVGASTTAKIENMAAGTSTLGGQVLNNGANFNIMLRSTTTGTLNVTGNINDSTFVGTVAIGSGSFANAGVVNFSRAAGNTYDGTTTVNSGTLLVNNTSGSATGAGTLTVASGATLGGNGSITGATTINGILAPGNSIGTLNVANDVTWNGAALASAATDWKFELGAANAADLLNITGAGSDFLKGSGSVFRFDFQGSTAEGTFKLVDWVGTSDFSIGDFSYTNLGAGNSGTFAYNGSQLEFTAVPEPSTAMTLLLGAIGIGLLVRNRRLTAANALR